VTATLDSSRNASRAALRPVGGAAGRRGATTPARLRSLLITLILLSLAWGAFGGWVASMHAAAASAVGAADERISSDARDMYESLADADATITETLLASSQPPLASLQVYQGDVARAEVDLSDLRAAGGAQETTAALAALAGGLPTYTSDVAHAESAYVVGYPLLGGSSVQVASEEAQLVLLPNAETVFTQENDVLAAASSQATGLPLVAVALLLAIGTAVVLYRAQRWLTRLTNRVFNPSLVFASLLLVISAIWLAVGFGVARSDLGAGIDHGSTPAQDLAQASIGVQQIRGDAVLNVISRSGNASFKDAFHSKMKSVGPGADTFLANAVDAQAANGTAASLVVAAEGKATSWYALNAQVYDLGAAASYASEKALVVGTGAGNSASAYNALELDINTDINKAITADETAFKSAATQASGWLNPLEPMVIVAALLMALGCLRGLSRRLAEYR